MDFDNLIGKVVGNDRVELDAALNSCRETTGVVLVAKYAFITDCKDGTKLLISAEPADPEAKTLRITDIRELD